MKKKQGRAVVFHVMELENRRLLSTQGLSAVWIGQDGHDLVGTSSTPGPDGVQDIDVAVSGLPANLTVVEAEVEGYGGGEWLYNGQYGPWAAAWVQAPGTTTADLYMDPYQVESGRSFTLTLTYSDNTTANVTFQGGTANPGLRMPADSVAAAWIGQDGQDLTGPADVGPDGIQDDEIALSNLYAGTTVNSVTITDPAGGAWQYGLNSQLDSNAEFVVDPSDSTQGTLYFNPVAGLTGQTLAITIDYANNTTDQLEVVAGASTPSLQMPAPAPVTIGWGTLSASWIGQDGQNLLGPGDVHAVLSGIPAGVSVVSATLSDEVSAEWIYLANGQPATSVDPNAYALALQRSSINSPTADIDFAPVRDETGATLTVVLTLSDGSMLAARFAGGTDNLSLLAPEPAATSVVVSPGEDLQTLANSYGTVHLTAGTYALSQPLVLKNPVTIIADPGVTLLFTQAPNAPTWTAAIKIEAGNTTLEGFSVRFTDTINWTANISYGPAVIGTSDDYDPAPTSALVNIVLNDLNLESPPAATSWEQAISLIEVPSALSGVISNNTLLGGVTEFLNGPWQITGNDYLGTVPDTYADGVFAGHFTHDVLIANNRAEPEADTGKTWRFLVLTQNGFNDVVENNDVVGVGPMDDDTVPTAYATEIILTESYALNFEGAPSSISADGLIVQIPTPQGGPARSGDVVSILAGPDAGQWRLIAQELSPTVYLLDAPISPDDTAISMSLGFVDTSFEGNTVNTTGSSTASDLVLDGNQFGLKVLNNDFIGGNVGMVIDAVPSQSPDFWGWSHVPVLSAEIEGNTLQDNVQGMQLDVQHGIYIKTDTGRTYFSATVSNNTVVWTSSFLAAHSQSTLVAMIFGDLDSADPIESLIAASGNAIELPAGTVEGTPWQIDSATVNGQAIFDQATALPSMLAAPTDLHLMNDSGVSATDLVTNDGSIGFSPVPSSASYEYSLTGAPGSFVPAGSSGSFLPAGLVQGTNTIYVAAIDASGIAGPAASITFVYDTTPPPAVTLLTASSAGGVQFAGGESGDTFEYEVGSSSNWIPLGTSTSFSVSDPADVVLTILVRAIDAAGNIGPAAVVVLTPPAQAAAPSPTVTPTPTPPSTNKITASGSETSTEPAGPTKATKKTKRLTPKQEARRARLAAALAKLLERRHQRTARKK